MYRTVHFTNKQLIFDMTHGAAQLEYAEVRDAGGFFFNHDREQIDRVLARSVDTRKSLEAPLSHE